MTGDLATLVKQAQDNDSLLGRHELVLAISERLKGTTMV